MKTIMLWNVPHTCHCAILLPVQKFFLVLPGRAQIPHRHLTGHTYLTQHIQQYIMISVWPFLPLFSPLTRLNRGVTQGLPDLTWVPRPNVDKATLQSPHTHYAGPHDHSANPNERHHLMELAKYRATGHDHSANLHEKHHLMELKEHRATGHLCPVSYLGPKFW
jgi:hypothetical protein